MENAVEPAALDATDYRILNELIENGRCSFSQLGQTVGLSPHGAADRVRRLQAAGVIERFTAIVALGNVGRGLDAYIDVRLLPKTDPEKFESFVQTLPAVRELVFVTGRFDYLIRVACRNADDLNQTVREIRRSGGAAQTETRIVMRAATARHPVA
jgi:Lrp/AsnC family leucine-responsive transcriptional regulator